MSTRLIGYRLARLYYCLLQGDKESPNCTQNTLDKVLESISALGKKADNTIRDVWRFTRPLTAAWNILNPIRNNPSVQHWGVLVADVDQNMMKSTVCHRKELKKHKGWGLGVIHELSRVGRQSAYRVYKWMSNAIKGGYHFMHVGQTRLKNDEILSKGKHLRCTLKRLNNRIRDHRYESSVSIGNCRLSEFYNDSFERDLLLYHEQSDSGRYDERGEIEVQPLE